MKKFDAHFHIIDFRFPVQESQGFFPPSFPAGDYQARTRGLDVVGGAVVSGSFQGFDQGRMLDALAQLGPTFVGVIQLPAAATDQEILGLDRAGVRGGSAGIGDLDRMARRVHDLARWHVELYADARELEPIHSTFAVTERECDLCHGAAVHGIM